MIYDELYDWQKAIVDKNKTRATYGLFLDCGLGKTPLSLALAEATNCNKIIVITINSKATESESVSGSWADWGRKVNGIKEIKNKLQAKKSGGRCDMLIVNYESLYERRSSGREAVTIRKEINDFVLGCIDQRIAIIVDESHKMKDYQSLQTKAIMKIKMNCRIAGNQVCTYLLSGTPFTTGFVDLWTQLKILGCSMTKAEFINKFCVKGHVYGLLEWQQPIVSYKNLDELYALIHQYALTVKSKDVVKLPEQIFVNHVTEPTKSFKLLTKERLYFNEIKDEMVRRDLPPETVPPSPRGGKIINPFYRNIAYPSMDWLADTSAAMWMRARQISIGFNGNEKECCWYDRSRLDSLKRFLEQNRDNYILFYNYTPEMVELYEICEELGYNIDLYCGEKHSTVFYERYESMSEEDRLVNKNNILLANFASGSTGMNWQLYNKCIIFSLPLYSHYEQGIKRIHRIGQKDTVVYHLFYQNNWLDKGMLKSLNDKVEYNEEMFKNDLRKEQTDE